MTALEGVYLPGVPSHPRVQQKRPNPYQRPSLNVGGSTVSREWRTVQAHTLKAGDTVPGIGVVTSTQEKVQASLRAAAGADGWTVVVEGGHGNRRSFTGYDLVLAFVPKAAG